MEKKIYIQAKDLQAYQLARQLSGLAWKVYDALSWPGFFQ